MYAAEICFGLYAKEVSMISRNQHIKRIYDNSVRSLQNYLLQDYQVNFYFQWLFYAVSYTKHEEAKGNLSELQINGYLNYIKKYY